MAWVNVIDLFYPVGIVITFDNSTSDPNSIFGGTWVQINDNALPSGYYYWRRTA